MQTDSPPVCDETNDVLSLRCVREAGHDGYHIHDHGNAVAAWGGSADHPHTDPGDGRTECDRCGKYVWSVIHSCKGVPVTAAARARLTRRNP